MYSISPNLNRIYPFKDKKDIALRDCFIVGNYSQITGCRPRKLQLNGTLWVDTPDIVSITDIGTFIFDEVPSMEKYFVNNLLETKYVNRPAGLWYVSVNGTKVNTISWTYSVDPPYPYLKKILLPGDAEIIGESITISGTDIIIVNVLEVSTALDSTRCPVKFAPGAIGPVGDQGPPGENGIDGEHMYLSLENSCDDPCGSFQQSICDIDSTDIADYPGEELDDNDRRINNELLPSREPLDVDLLCYTPDETSYTLDTTHVYTDCKLGVMEPDYYEDHRTLRQRCFLDPMPIDSPTSPYIWPTIPKVDDGKFDFAYFDDEQCFFEVYIAGANLYDTDTDYIVEFSNVETQDGGSTTFYALSTLSTVKERTIDQNTLYICKPFCNCDDPFEYYCSMDGKKCLLYTTWDTSSVLEEKLFLVFADGESIQLKMEPTFQCKIRLFNMATNTKSAKISVSDGSILRAAARAGTGTANFDGDTMKFMSQMEGPLKNITSAEILIHDAININGQYSNWLDEQQDRSTLDPLDSYKPRPGVLSPTQLNSSNGTGYSRYNTWSIFRQTPLTVHQSTEKWLPLYFSGTDINYEPRVALFVVTTEKLSDQVSIIRYHNCRQKMCPVDSTQGSAHYLTQWVWTSYQNIDYTKCWEEGKYCPWYDSPDNIPAEYNYEEGFYYWYEKGADNYDKRYNSFLYYTETGYYDVATSSYICPPTIASTIDLHTKDTMDKLASIKTVEQLPDVSGGTPVKPMAVNAIHLYPKMAATVQEDAIYMDYFLPYSNQPCTLRYAASPKIIGKLGTYCPVLPEREIYNLCKWELTHILFFYYHFDYVAIHPLPVDTSTNTVTLLQNPNGKDYVYTTIYTDISLSYYEGSPSSIDIMTTMGAAKYLYVRDGARLILYVKRPLHTEIVSTIVDDLSSQFYIVYTIETNEYCIPIYPFDGTYKNFYGTPSTAFPRGATITTVIPCSEYFPVDVQPPATVTEITIGCSFPSWYPPLIVPSVEYSISGGGITPISGTMSSSVRVPIVGSTGRGDITISITNTGTIPKHDGLFTYYYVSFTGDVFTQFIF